MTLDEEKEEEKKEEVNLSEELKLLGKQFGAVVKAFMASNEMRDVQEELRSAWKDVADDVQGVLGKALESDEAQQLREKAEEAKSSWKEGELQKNIRREISSALHSANEQLQATIANLQQKSTAGEETSTSEQTATASPPSDEAKEQ